MGISIKAENLSKIYRLGEIGTGTVSHDLERWLKVKVMGRQDPFLHIGETNDRSTKGNSNIVYSLRDINFEINEGDTVGIIGKNGAGKSTLLKLLSRVTSPSTGRIKIKGRVASLLEVGTGFHPELTGRENIFLNGAILGMRKKEITRKLEEIIDFSGVERYIDTPVKRYSSGMYVRLAFAVAANLESEILIVDEVLAVGDAEFQKKCLGKMGEVSKGEGRTILFVSHNMGSIALLCKNGILLKNGQIDYFGEVTQVINSYQAQEGAVSSSRKWKEENAPGDDSVKLLEVQLVDSNSEPATLLLLGDKKFAIEFTYKVISASIRPVPQLHFHNKQQQNSIFISYGYYNYCSYYDSNEVLAPGIYKSTVWLNTPIFNTQTYQVGVGFSNLENLTLNFWEQDAISFEVVEDFDCRRTLYKGPIGGLLRPELEWQTTKLD